jgi:8-amino-7-oxononanoate synthase
VSKGPALSCLNRTHVTFQGRQYLFFGGNDYHRLASHPEVIAACRREAEAGGLSCTGSRITTGNHPLLETLEKKLADFLGTEEAALCSEGYLSNTVVLEVLADEPWRLFLDSAAHVSLGAPARGLYPERVHEFRHAEPDDLARHVRDRLRPGERPLVLTDGVGASDGSLGPLAGYWEAVKEQDGLLLVDDAHGIATVGPGGRGSAAAAGLPAEACILTATLSKALGAFGGLAAGPAWLAARVPVRSNAYKGTTPIPPPLAAAGICSLEILRKNPSMIRGLQERTARVRARLKDMGFDTGASPAPIVSISRRSAEGNERLRDGLLERGFYVPLITGYPGSPPGGHLRLTLSSLHAEEDVERLLDAIARCCG